MQVLSRPRGFSRLSWKEDSLNLTGVNNRDRISNRKRPRGDFALLDRPRVLRVGSLPSHLPGTPTEEPRWGQLRIALRTGHGHGVWLARGCPDMFTTLPPSSSRSRRLRAPQELLGHQDAKATVNYTQVLKRAGKAVRSTVSDV